MKLATIVLLIPFVFCGEALSQSPKAGADRESAPFLRIGLTGSMGVHRMYGDMSQSYASEETRWSIAVHPELNSLAAVGLNLQLQKPGTRISGQLTTALGVQYHHFSYDWSGSSRSKGAFWGTQKVGEHIMQSDVALRLKVTGRQEKPWAIAIGGFAGVRLLARTRSYVKLDRGNIIQSQSLAAPAGALVQLSRHLSGKTVDWEPFVEARLGLNAISYNPVLRNASLQVGATLWLPQ